MGQWGIIIAGWYTGAPEPSNTPLYKNSLLMRGNWEMPRVEAFGIDSAILAPNTPHSLDIAPTAPPHLCNNNIGL
jgi:hypothetical protein